MGFSGENGLIKGMAGRVIVRVLMLAWLNVAAQPCLMAMETAPDASPASEHSVHFEQSEHLSHASGMPNCGHCPPLGGEQAIPCETGSASDCELFPGYNLDGRQYEQQAKSVSSPAAPLLLIDTVDCSAAVTRFLPHDVKQLKFNGDPPLNIRHCVFLK